MENESKQINPNLIPCKSCGHMVAKSAKKCPQCGAKLKKSWGCLISILVFVLIIVALVGAFKIKRHFGPTNRKATVVNNSGVTEELSRNDIKKIYDDNKAYFDELYFQAPIEFEGKVKGIDTNTHINGSVETYDVVSFEEGFSVEVLHDTHSELVGIKKGDKLKVKSKIYSAFGAVSLRDKTKSFTLDKHGNEKDVTLTDYTVFVPVN